ncbi:MAG: hypothetical protein OEW05_06895 [Candidatus Aminicenantes bacterium]|nr:hypothetical protein [Candidatus Aminicenantes bacterium]
MNLRLALARIYVPRAKRRRKLVELFGVTARAFRVAPPSLEGLAWSEQLCRYGDYTRQLAEKTLREGADTEAVKARLFEEAFRLGRGLALELKIVSPGEALRAARILYRNLRIDLRGDDRGRIIIRTCYFSRFYSPEVCRLMSSLDSGILAGLAGGGALEFEECLTEGQSRCLARFHFRERD